MNNPEISIIVPVYNVEKYLNKCIDSILQQTFTNFELILVDDGSKDKSGQICDRYASEDNRVRVVHSKNNGAATARNIGLDMARGKYIGFVDSDDFIDFRMYEKLYGIIVREGEDIVFTKIIYWINDDNLIKANEAINEGRIQDIKGKLIAPIIGNRLDRYKEERVSPSLIRCLFKNDIININKIRLKEGLLYGEDTLFMIEYLDKCKCAYIIDDYLYYYRNNIQSITNRYKSNFFQAVELYFDYMDKFVTNKRYCNDENILERLTASKVTYTYWALLNEVKRESKTSYLYKFNKLKIIFKSNLYKKYFRFKNIFKYPLKIRIKMLIFKFKIVYSLNFFS